MWCLGRVQLCVVSGKSAAAAITSLLQKRSHSSKDDDGDEIQRYVIEKHFVTPEGQKVITFELLETCKLLFLNYDNKH